MPRRARIGTDAWSGHVVVPGQVRPEQWPAVDADALPEARRTQFRRRKTGIVLYSTGASEADIRAACGFGRSHIYRHNTERCLAQHPDGNVTRTHGTQLRLKLKHNFSCVSALIGSVAFFIINLRPDNLPSQGVRKIPSSRTRQIEGGLLEPPTEATRPRQADVAGREHALRAFPA
jgi:hypothetical protein